jgi:hypothetical protein
MTQEWTTRDKTEWGDGPWQHEADKVQWVDGATGLDCLIVRGPSGALCGYVGVPEGHPLHGKGYNQCPQSPPCEESYCGHSAESRFHVHGGITFADSCHEATPERWNQWRTMMHASREEAAKYPHGDAAERWATMGHMIDDYNAFRAWGEAGFICHVPQAGRPDKVWWFGFDCAHSGDVTPKYHNHPRLSFLSSRDRDDEYRTRAYVESEVRSLAAQLAA